MEAVSVSSVLDALFKLKTLEFLLAAALFGMIGGLAQKFAAEQGGAKKGSWLASVVIGGSAAIAILFILVPNDPIRLVSMCLIAGYGGKAVLDSLQAKLNTAKIAEAKAQFEESVSAAIDDFNDKILPALAGKANVLELSGKSGPLQSFSDEILKFSGVLHSLQVKTKKRSEE